MLDDNTLNKIEETRAQFEFLTFLVTEDNGVKVGIVQNETPKLVMLYDMDKIRNEDAKARFLAHADKWWWESNRAIPVDSFIGLDFDEFRHDLIGYPKKAIKELIGPTFSLQNLYLKRIKKRKIEIVSTSPVCA